MKTSRSLVLPYRVEGELIALGGRIALARKARSWTQADLAARAGVGLNSIVNIERGSATVQIGYWFLALWTLGLLEGIERVAQLEDDPTGMALVKEGLRGRVRSSS